jgi:signal transduction histidine kinase
MIAPRKTDNESERLKALKSYQILDSLPEIEYDDLTRIASQICNVPITLISLIDQDRQWFKSKIGINAEETTREISFCGHAILDPKKPLIVEDASKDNRFVDNPLVTGAPHIAFYAGIPLVDHDGFALGTLCAIDEKPRHLNSNQIECLQALGRQVVQLLELRRSKLALEEKNEYLNRFTSIAAHDIKAPIHNINSLAQLLLEQGQNSFPPSAFEMIEKIQYSADKLTDLINGLLEYSREHQDIQKQFEWIKISAVISDLKSLLLNNTECKIEYTSEIEKVFSHPTLLIQLLTNLVSNGIKYNDKVTPLIQLHFSKFDNNYQIEIKDNGPGIAECNHEQIFEPFVVKTSKDRFGKKGHGLGLATVRKIVSAMNGEIKLVSEMEKGSSFTITLPILE